MKTIQEKQQLELANLIKQNSSSNAAIPIYLSSLLFAIVLNIYWLIIVFSGLLFISFFISLNKRFNWIQLKRK